MAINIIEIIAYILFRLPFGSRSAPGSFYVSSEMMVDSHPDTLSSR